MYLVRRYEHGINHVSDETFKDLVQRRSKYMICDLGGRFPNVLFISTKVGVVLICMKKFTCTCTCTFSIQHLWLIVTLLKKSKIRRKQHDNKIFSTFSSVKHIASLVTRLAYSHFSHWFFKKRLWKNFLYFYIKIWPSIGTHPTHRDHYLNKIESSLFWNNFIQVTALLAFWS